MTETVKRLDSLISDVQGTVRMCSESKNKKQLVSSLSATVSEISSTISYLKENEKRNYIELRKALQSVSNVMSGIVDGLRADDLPRPDFLTVVKTLRTKFVPRIRDGLIAQVESSSDGQDDEPLRESNIPEGVRNRIKIVISKSSEMRDAVTVVSQSNTIGHNVNGNVRMSPLESLGLLARQSLPVKITGSFKLVRIPIVPVFHNPLKATESALHSMGIKNQNIEGIPILLDQLVLIVSRTSSSEKANANTSAMAHSVIEVLNERGHTKYEIVTDTPTVNPRNTDLLMFWVLPRQKMTALMRILGSAKVKWGLPLPSDSAEIELERVARREREAEELEAKKEAAIQKAAEERERKQKEREARKAQEAERRDRRSDEQHKADLEKKARNLAEEKRRQDLLDNKLKALVRKNKQQHK